MTAKSEAAPELEWRTGGLFDQIEQGDDVVVDHDYFAGSLTVERVLSQVSGKSAIVTTGQDPFGQGGSVYRLRKDDPDDAVLLLLEKYTGDYDGDAVMYDYGGWTPHLRVKARVVDDA